LAAFNLEQAAQLYLKSRYLPAEFFKSQLENMEKFVESLINFLKKL
jgi:HEPN domain-containing protein